MPKPARQTAPKGKHVSFASAAPDSRFDALSTDPRYRLPSKKRTHIKLDKRLGGILKDDEFSKKASVDRYGRKVAKGQGKKELQRLYRLDSEDEEDDDQEVLAELADVDRKYDPARDGGFSSSESDSSSSDDDDASEAESEVDAELPALADEVPMGEVSSRLAVVNLDWDNITAEDIMSVAASFAGPEGRIVSVAVYPSEFGRERMEREETEGPPKEIFNPERKKKVESTTNGDVKSSMKDRYSEDEDDSDSSEDEAIKKQLLEEDTGIEFDSVALRKYQLDRLRYYYAVITCSSNVVAKALYDNMDGQEYLSSANFFDMRFIPDEVDFENDRPREICKKIPESYKPSEFTTDALMHSNVKLTWDADDQKRKEVQKRAFSRKDIDENDLMAYIGSGSSSEEEEEEEDEVIDESDPEADVKSTASRATTRQARREALRAALGLDLDSSSTRKANKEEKHVGDMQITFMPALSSKAKSGESVFENEPIPAEETTQERYIRKERERKAQRKERTKNKRTEENGEAEDTQDAAQMRQHAEAAEEEQEEDPFNDPFFDNPAAANERSKAERRKEKMRQKQAAKAAADSTSRSERAELELMMLDDDAGAAAGSTRKHFDMRAIEKADKQARKAAKKQNSKKKKGNTKQQSSGLEEDDGAGEENGAATFDINTKDERFTKLFEDPAFAIDPTNPKFRDTKGMRTILGEKRKRGEARVAHAESKSQSDGGSSLVDGMKQTAERIGKRLKVKS